MALERQVTLSGVANGAAEELFQQAFNEMLENAMNPNTPTKARRSVTITFELKVDEKRQNPTLLIRTALKVAPVTPITQPIRVGRHQGDLVAVEPFTQEEMFPEPAGRPRAVVEGGAS